MSAFQRRPRDPAEFTESGPDQRWFDLIAMIFSPAAAIAAASASFCVTGQGQQHLPGDEAWLIGEHRVRCSTCDGQGIALGYTPDG
jgi:hypothetical protein